MDRILIIVYNGNVLFLVGLLCIGMVILKMMNNGYLNVTDNEGNKISGEKLLFYIENTKI